MLGSARHNSALPGSVRLIPARSAAPQQLRSPPGSAPLRSAPAARPDGAGLGGGRGANRGRGTYGVEHPLYGGTALYGVRYGPLYGGTALYGVEHPLYGGTALYGVRRPPIWGYDPIWGETAPYMGVWPYMG